MKVTIDEDRCRGHGICSTVCPEVFDLSEDGYAVVVTPEVPDAHLQAVRSAAGLCPERAITTS